MCVRVHARALSVCMYVKVYLNVAEVSREDSDWLDVVSAPQASSPVIRTTHKVETTWTEDIEGVDICRETQKINEEKLLRKRDRWR